MCSPSGTAPSQERIERDTELPTANSRSGRQPPLADSHQQPPVARSFGEHSSQPHIVLGTPLPAIQQSSSPFCALAPAPAAPQIIEPVASHSTLLTGRGGMARIDYAYLAGRFRRGGKDSQDDSAREGARAKRAAIQRENRSRRVRGKLCHQPLPYPNSASQGNPVS